MTPIGDPPLFLGYLKGVPFFWLLTKPQVLGAWVLCVGVLLVVFFLFDWRNFAKHEKEVKKPTEDRIQVEGSHNFLWLVVIIALVLLQKAEWLKDVQHWPLMQSWGNALGWGTEKTAESLITVAVAALMTLTAVAAYKLSNKRALKENEFNFLPVYEVGRSIPRHFCHDGARVGFAGEACR